MAMWIAIERQDPIGPLGIGRASQALQSGLPSILKADSINSAAAAMVTGADCWLAQTHILDKCVSIGLPKTDYECD